MVSEIDDAFESDVRLVYEDMIADEMNENG
jgi:hypothetical protein